MTTRKAMSSSPKTPSVVKPPPVLAKTPNQQSSLAALSPISTKKPIASSSSSLLQLTATTRATPLCQHLNYVKISNHLVKSQNSRNAALLLQALRQVWDTNDLLPKKSLNITHHIRKPQNSSFFF